MTYFGFLAIFLGIPLGILSLWTIRDFWRGKWMPRALSTWQPWVILIVLCVMAFVYTTPWDNYLVATGVWRYDIDLVSGIVFGYVPIEEYTFFILQPIMTGLLMISLARHLKHKSQQAGSMRIRIVGTSVVAITWLISCGLLGLSLISSDWKSFTYLSLELSWALIPIIVQMAFGADILWRHQRVIVLAIIISTVYLSFADALAIGAGTWTIDPQQSLNIFLFGVLPIEEFVFFLLTNSLIVIGMTLFLAQESLQRAMNIVVLRPLIRFHLKVTGSGLSE